MGNDNTSLHTQPTIRAPSQPSPSEHGRAAASNISHQASQDLDRERSSLVFQGPVKSISDVQAAPHDRSEIHGTMVEWLPYQGLADGDKPKPSTQEPETLSGDVMLLDELS
jgi:hypothetical protein